MLFSKGWASGVITEHRTHVEGARSRPYVEVFVRFDDGSKTWVDPRYSQIRLTEQSCSPCERISLRCCLSLAPLTDPARGEACQHSPRCNYDDLRECISKTRMCPVAGCTATVRARAIVRDVALRDALHAFRAAGTSRSQCDFATWDRASGTLHFDGASASVHSTHSHPRRRHQAIRAAAQPAAGLAADLSRTRSSQRVAGNMAYHVGHTLSSARGGVIELDVSDESEEAEEEEAEEAEEEAVVVEEAEEEEVPVGATEGKDDERADSGLAAESGLEALGLEVEAEAHEACQAKESDEAEEEVALAAQALAVVERSADGMANDLADDGYNREAPDSIRRLSSRKRRAPSLFEAGPSRRPAAPKLRRQDKQEVRAHRHARTIAHHTRTRTRSAGHCWRQDESYTVV